MRKIISKITASFLAFLVLFSTISFAVEKHFCGDFLVDISLFAKADSCGMDMMAMVQDDGCATIKTSCCSEKTEIIKGQDTAEKAHKTLESHQVVFLQAFVYSYVNLFEGLETHVIPFRDYTPPFLVRDISILNETFLI